MQRVLCAELSDHVGRTVRLAGWVHRRRLLKSVAFLILRDRSGLAQIVVGGAELAGPSATRTALEALPEETVVTVTGRVVSNVDAPGGAELVDPSWVELSDPARPLPFDLYRPELRANLPTMLDHAPVALRHPRQRAAFELAAAAVAGFRSTLDGLGFTEVQTPKIVGSSTESGATVFTLDYSGRPAYLAQSPQFYKQTLVGVFERWTARLLEADNVREVTLFPRDLHRLAPYPRAVRRRCERGSGCARTVPGPCPGAAQACRTLLPAVPTPGRCCCRRAPCDGSRPPPPRRRRGPETVQLSP
jgi:aspartyl/asparaginyl-tRNA synthetase